MLGSLFFSVAGIVWSSIMTGIATFFLFIS